VAQHAVGRAGDALKALVRLTLGFTLPRFLAVGCLGLGSDALVFSGCSAAGASDALARIVSLSIATLLTWRLNRRFTFEASGRRPHSEAARYAAVALCAQGFNLVVFLALRGLAPAMPALLAIVLSAVLAASFSFTGQSLLTFRARLAGTAPTLSGTIR
jgi:putative flippase GtrA